MFQHIKISLFLTSIVYILLGACLIIWPEASIHLCCYALGGLLLLNGLTQVIRFIRHKAEGFFTLYLSLVFGVVCCAAGLFLLLTPNLAVSIFPIVFGLFVIFDSVARFGNALDLKKAGYSRWWSFLLLSLLSVALGVFMVTNPFSTVSAMVTAVGVILLIEGVLNLGGVTYTSLMVRGLNKAAQKLAAVAEEASMAQEAAGDGPISPDEAAVAEPETLREKEEGPIIDVDSHPVE